MEAIEFISLCETEPYQESNQEEPYDEGYRDCVEQRWQENNREINLRNYEERPEDYR